MKSELVSNILPRMARDTHTDRPTGLSLSSLPAFGDWLASPGLLASLVILANVLKPVVVDDTAYLAFGRHIATHPFDPYGFQFFWYDVPQPAMEILAPPVLPYWLGMGIRLFGEQVALLKLWMFPFVWLLAWAMRQLLYQFAPGTESRLLPILVLSAAVGPTVNLMLDIPALALGLAAVVLFLRALAHHSTMGAVLAGLVAAVAMQTKYTMLLLPPVMAWLGWTQRRRGLSLMSVIMAIGGFSLWEGLLLYGYGQSHFLVHVRSQSGGNGFVARLQEKAELAPPLVGHLGCLGVGLGLVAGAALGLRGRGLLALAIVWSVGVVGILILPYRWTVLIPRLQPAGTDTTAVMIFWQTFGTAILLGIGCCAAGLIARWKAGWPTLRRNPDAWFLAGWLGIELLGYFVLTPFGAARRVIGVTMVSALLAARLLSRVERLRPPRRLPIWVVGFSIATGALVTLLDLWDAFPEKVCAQRAAALASDSSAGATVWYVGHWGFQYYCERAGLQPLVPGESVLRPGDLLVLPRFPDAHALYRPHVAWGLDPPDAHLADPLGEVIWDDWLSGQTIPNFYGGIDPIVGRDYPRLRVVVYRFKRDWAVPR